MDIKVYFMCYNCGCQNPQDNMGDVNNITEETLKHLSEHLGKSLQDTKLTLLKMLESQDKKLEEDEHLKQMFEKAAQAWGQSLNQAKENAKYLLKKQLKKGLEFT